MITDGGSNCYRALLRVANRRQMRRQLLYQLSYGRGWEINIALEQRRDEGLRTEYSVEVLHHPFCKAGHIVRLSKLYCNQFADEILGVIHNF